MMRFDAIQFNSPVAPLYAVPVQRRLACAVDLRLSCDLRMSDLRLIDHSQVISIAHRLNFIRNSDRILVLNAGGTVNAFDTPAKLLEDTEGCESHNSVATQSQLSHVCNRMALATPTVYTTLLSDCLRVCLWHVWFPQTSQSS